jgi:hypothetical protein
MKALRKRIKGLILNTDGLPGYDLSEYLAEMEHIVRSGLSPQYLTELKRHKIDLKQLILELSQEIGEEIL